MLRRFTLAAAIGLVVAALGLAGCSGPSATSGPPVIADPVEAAVIGVVLPAGGFAEVEYWQQVALAQEARTRAVARLYRLEPDDPPAREADLIRKAAADGCSALVVLAQDAEAVAPAVAEVRKAGMPVVILDNPVPSDGMPPAPTVSYEDDAAVAKKLVEAAMADATEEGFPADGPALIVSNTSTDPHSLARIKALHGALDAAGVRVLTDAKFAGYKEAATTAMAVAHDITPHVAMVFLNDDDAVRGVNEFRHLMERKGRRFVIAGYAVTPDLMKLAGGLEGGNVAAAMVDRRVGELMRVAFDTALALARGETVPSDIRVATPMIRRTGKEFKNFFPPYMGKPEMLRGEGNPK
jgi:ABC-type sugar transport system substrate-binding protein